MSNAYPPSSGSFPPGQQFGGQTHSPNLRPPNRSNTWVPWAIGAVVITGMMGLACCGGVAMLAKVGLDFVSEDIERQIRDQPAVQENIGEIESMSMSLMASGNHPDDETFVYELKGSKGDGELTVKSQTQNGGGELIESASIRMKDGKTFQLDFP